mgnify:FL=1
MIKNFKKYVLAVPVILTMVFMATSVLADLPVGGPITFDSIDRIGWIILNFLIYLSGTVMFIAIILSGLLMIWSHGEEKSFEKGKQMLKTTIWGSAVIMGSSLIINILTSILNGTFSLIPAENIIGILANFIIGLAGTVMITFVVISGIMMMTAGENPEKFKKARQMLVNTIWGSLVIMGAGVILNTVYAVITGEFFCRLSLLGICLWR